jgi:hypothetical protein
MDTGSTGIVVPLSAIGEYTPAQNPPNYTPSYSSSGNSYQGQWVETVVTVIDADGNSFTTPTPILVFGVTYPAGSAEAEAEAEGNTSGVSMMGVSTRFPDADSYNPFLNHPDIVSGTFRAGYIVSENGVQFGYNEQDIATFAVYPTTVITSETANASQVRTAQAQVTLTPPEHSGLNTYTEATPFLMDTGIDYAIITPRTTPETAGGTAPTLPVPDLWQVTIPQQAPALERTQLKSGVTVAVSLLDAQGAYQPVWSFNASDFGKPDVPAYARLAVPSADGIFNTGRHFMATYNYLADMTGNQIGIRKLTA